MPIYGIEDDKFVNLTSVHGDNVARGVPQPGYALLFFADKDGGAPHYDVARITKKPDGAPSPPPRKARITGAQFFSSVASKMDERTSDNDSNPFAVLG